MSKTLVTCCVPWLKICSQVGLFTKAFTQPIVSWTYSAQGCWTSSIVPESSQKLFQQKKYRNCQFLKAWNWKLVVSLLQHSMRHSSHNRDQTQSQIRRVSKNLQLSFTQGSSGCKWQKTKLKLILTIRTNCHISEKSLGLWM